MSEYASCCILSYNRLNLLLPSLETLLANANSPLELIVHDDGSDAGPLHEWLLKQLVIGNISTLILNKPGHNQGQGTALNRMFGMATGDPIIKLDHDLLYNPGWLRQTQLILDANQQACYESDQVPEIGLLGLLHYWHEPVHSDKTLVAKHDGWTEHTHILGSAFALTRKAWEHYGPFEEHSTAFAEDWAMQDKIYRSKETFNADGSLSPDLAVGLPPSDLVVNKGMGYGPSTVNVAPDIVASINTVPHIIGAP